MNKKQRSAHYSLFIIHYSIKRLALASIRLYQRYVSPLTGQTCRFRPTCSEYTYQATARYGILYGSWLGLRRIVKCHPWHKGGYDPVPKKRHETRDK